MLGAGAAAAWGASVNEESVSERSSRSAQRRGLREPCRRLPPPPSPTSLESSGRPVAGPAARLLPRLEVRSGTLDARGDVQGSIPNLVEARAAINRPIVPWRKWNDGLPPAGAADGGMEFTWSFCGSSALGCRPARRASLRVVQQALARIEGLLARGEGELLPAVTTGQAPILVHPRRFLLARSLA